jgi:hypothetical protein
VVSHARPLAQSAALLQPHAPLKQRWPAVALVQLRHTLPVPHAAPVVPAAHVTPLQQPPLHHTPPPQVVVQRRWTGSQAKPTAQSAEVVQPHAPATQVCPWVLALQSAQVPAAPHAVGVLPVAQVPLAQQPPLHGAAPLQAVPQAPFRHACPSGQSLALVQPHLLLARQRLPAGLVVQSTHWVPLPPHELLEVPWSQVPLLAAVQQPDEHGVALPQVFTQLPPVHDALPFGQSVSALQPHWPPPSTARQAWPSVLVAQLAHSAPDDPQAVPAVPG